MGIRGLLSFCRENKEQCSDQVDLISVAKDRDGIEILVDFYSFEHMILPKFWKGLSLLRNNEYLRIDGGEYGTLETFVARLVEILKQLKINLVFFVDATKGCSTSATRQKIDTWQNRHYRDVEKLNEMIDVCRGTREMHQIEENTFVRPVCLEMQIIHTLRQCGCDIIQSVTGEADFMIAKALQEREKAYAILSNDSDFCIFQNSRFIPNEMFDINNDFQMGLPIEVPVKPESIICNVVTTTKVMNALGFRSHHLLIELSIVAGNDFTGHFMQKLINQLDIRGRRIQNFADWVKHYQRIENHGDLAQEMSYNTYFASSVDHSRKFYSLTSSPEVPTRKGFFTQVLTDGINLGKYSSNLMAMHNNFYWHRMLLEDTTYGQPCVEVALAELRGHIYRIVLPRQENMVNEYGRSPWEQLRIAGVLAVDDPDIPPLNRIQENKIFWNLKTFHHIMSHQEPGQSTIWFDRYGRKNGFIVYCLRYFLLLNWGRNLHISEQEFLALTALAFGRPNEEHYQQIKLRPTPRCVSVGNWFQDVYRHAYLFLGALLFLTHEFPLPKEIFCGSAWTAFYMCCKDDTYYAASSQAPQDLLRWVQEQMNNVIGEKRHMIRYITEGIFPFNDKF